MNLSKKTYEIWLAISIIICSLLLLLVLVKCKIQNEIWFLPTFTVSFINLISTIFYKEYYKSKNDK